MSAHHVQIDVFADGVAIKEPGAECFRLLRQYLDGILMVTFSHRHAEHYVALCQVQCF